MRDLVIPSAIAVAGILIAIGTYAYVRGKTPAEPATVSAGAHLNLIPSVGAQDHILGNPTAPVVIIEYSDFDCPFCKQFHDTLRALMATYGAAGDVALVMREFPLTELHPNAARHAQAAECAALASGNDAFWKFGDLLFAGQPTDPARYPELVSQAGVDASAFASCVEASATAPLVARERQDALSAGAQGTPFSLILVKGRDPVPVPGALPYDQMQALIDHAVRETK